MSVVQECEPASFVLIAVPAYTGQVAVMTMMSIVGGCAQLTKMGVKVAVACVESQVYVQHARNHLVKQFLESPATDILFVDSDVGFAQNAMVQVTQARRPFVAGVYPKRTDEESWPVGFDSARVIEDDADGFLNPVEVPGGFMRLNRAVFDSLDGEEYLHGGELHRAFFRCGPMNREFVGEDIDFCRRWTALGGRIYMVPDLTFTHTGTKTWMGNWSDSARVD